MVSTATASLRPADLAAATPASRDRTIDALRALAILVVVLGHWLIAVVQWDGQRATASNALAEAPALQWLTWLFQVMPLFFVVGGFANRAALRSSSGRQPTTAAYLTSRVRRLAAPVLPLALTWLVAGPVLRHVVGLDGATVDLLTKTLAQPLWFLAVYLLVSALAPLTLRLHERTHPLAVAAALTAVVAVNDLTRLPFVHHLNYLAVFVLAHQLGYSLGDGRLDRLTRRHAATLAAAGAAALVVLTGPGPYPRSMLGVPGEATSNMSPPSLAIVALTALQLGLVLLARPALGRLLHRSRPLWTAVVVVSGSIMTVFLWHLTALAAGAALLLAGPLPFPTGHAVGSGGWWLLRLPWLATMALVLAGIVAVAGRTERRALTTKTTDGGSRPWLPPFVIATTAMLALALEGFGVLATAVPATAGLYLIRRMFSG
jgi:fucose 4-O-acetylase-like acetyltransferase